MGVPSPCTEDNEQNQCFKRVGRAAWMLSVHDEIISLDKAQEALDNIRNTPGYWEQDEELICDFDIIPEVAAGAVGYAKSALRREGLHLIIDIGAFTLGACGFILDQQASDSYNLLTADVQQLGTIRLHHERINAIQLLYQKQADELRDKHDPIKPISEDIEPYLLSRERILPEVNQAEKNLMLCCCRMYQRIIGYLKTRRAPSEDVWEKRFPIILIGGGSKLSFFGSVLSEFDEWLRSYAKNEGIINLEVPLPKTISSKSVEYYLLTVAWGLSHRKPDIGEIIPADRTPDMEPPKNQDWERYFVGKEQV